MKLNPAILVVATLVLAGGGAYAWSQNAAPDANAPGNLQVELTFVGSNDEVQVVTVDYAPANPLKAMTFGVKPLSVSTPGKDLGSGVVRIDGRMEATWVAENLKTDIDTYAFAKVVEVAGKTTGNEYPAQIQGFGTKFVPKTGGKSSHTFEGLAAASAGGALCGKQLKTYFTISGKATDVVNAEITATDDAYATATVTCSGGGKIGVSLQAMPFSAVQVVDGQTRTYTVEPVSIGFT